MLFARVPNASPLQFPLKEPQQNKTRTGVVSPADVRGDGCFPNVSPQGRVMGQGSLFSGVSRGENSGSGEQGRSAVVLCK